MCADIKYTQGNIPLKGTNEGLIFMYISLSNKYDVSIYG